METKSYDEIYIAMKNHVIANQDKLTDFNDGSIISSLLEASARQIAMLYIRGRVGYDSYLKNLPYSAFGFIPKQGVKASGSVVFLRAKLLTVSTQIQSGTTVSAGNLKFKTTASTVIPANAITSKAVAVQAVKIGSDYNVIDGAITVIDSVLSSDVVSVTNSAPLVGGANQEQESAYLERFRSYITGLQRTNIYGLKSAALSLNEVRSCSIVEHFPPINDNRCNISLYIDDGTGHCPESLKEEVDYLIKGDGTAGNPGYKAAGINVQVLAPTVYFVDISLTITTERVEKAVAIAETTEAIKNYINSLLVGNDVILTTIIFVLKRISYIEDVVITEPLVNIPLSNNQIARFKTATIKVISK